MNLQKLSGVDFLSEIWWDLQNLFFTMSKFDSTANDFKDSGDFQFHLTSTHVTSLIENAWTSGNPRHIRLCKFVKCWQNNCCFLRSKHAQAYKLSVLLSLEGKMWKFLNLKSKLKVIFPWSDFLHVVAIFLDENLVYTWYNY